MHKMILVYGVDGHLNDRGQMSLNPFQHLSVCVCLCVCTVHPVSIVVSLDMGHVGWRCASHCSHSVQPHPRAHSLSVQQNRGLSTEEINAGERFQTEVNFSL